MARPRPVLLSLGILTDLVLSGLSLGGCASFGGVDDAEKLWELIEEAFPEIVESCAFSTDLRGCSLEGLADWAVKADVDENQVMLLLLAWLCDAEIVSSGGFKGFSSFGRMWEQKALLAPKKKV